MLNGRPPHKAEWTSRHLPNGSGKQRPSGKPRPAAGEVLVILEEESGPSLSLSIIYPSDSRGGAPYLQQVPGIKSCAHRRAVENGSGASPGAGLVQQDLEFFV